VRAGRHLHVVCCCLALVSAGPALVRDAAAQTTQDDYHLNKDVAEACSFRNTRKCVRVMARVWDRFSNTALSALPSGFRRDGVFPGPTAPAMLALNGFATADLRTKGCAQLPVSREQLTLLVCHAREQLRPYGRTNWERENRRLEEVQRFLTDLSCLPADALDRCAQKPVASVTPDESVDRPSPDGLEVPPPAEIGEPIDLADQRRSEPVVNLQ
jgi:hypothetical protein